MRRQLLCCTPHLLIQAPCSASERVLSPLWPWPDTSRILQSFLTSVPHSPRPKRQAALGLHLPPIPGKVASFVLRACYSATPARRAAPRHAVPSRRRGDTIVVSVANWAPCDPSTNKPSELGQIQVADENVRRRLRTRFPAHLCSRTLQRIAPSTQDPCLKARCTMMAK